jgi:hypothetical protein
LKAPRAGAIAGILFSILLSRCTQFPESRLFVFNPFPGFDCIATALKFRTVAHKTRTKFLLKFVRDLSTKITLLSFRASGFGPGFAGSSALSVQGGDGKLDEFDTLKLWANMLIL